MSCFCECSVALPHGTMGWSAVCEIVEFLDHTHLLLNCVADSALCLFLLKPLFDHGL